MDIVTSLWRMSSRKAPGSQADSLCHDTDIFLVLPLTSEWLLIEALVLLSVNLVKFLLDEWEPL